MSRRLPGGSQQSGGRMTHSNGGIHRVRPQEANQHQSCGSLLDIKKEALEIHFLPDALYRSANEH